MNEQGALTAMLGEMSKEQTETEAQIAALTAHVEDLKSRRLEVERLLAWKPGDPLPVLTVPTKEPAKTTNGSAHPGEDADHWVAEIKAKHGKKWVRSEALKAEFPHINFQVMFGRKMIHAQGSGRGREYKLR